MASVKVLVSLVARDECMRFLRFNISGSQEIDGWVGKNWVWFHKRYSPYIWQHNLCWPVQPHLLATLKQKGSLTLIRCRFGVSLWSILLMVLMIVGLPLDFFLPLLLPSATQPPLKIKLLQTLGTLGLLSLWGAWVYRHYHILRKEREFLLNYLQRTLDAHPAGD